MKLAVISDLHAGRARGSDLNPEDLETSEQITDEYVDDFTDFVVNNGLETDFLIIPGDVSNGAQEEQVALASDAVKKCAEALSVPLERVIFVPGNHDVDWGQLGGAGSPNRRYGSFRHRKTIFPRLAEDAERSLFDEPYFKSWAFGDLLAVGYNSAWEPDVDPEINPGKIPLSHLQKLKEYLSGLEAHLGRLRVFVVHHHPIVHSNTGTLDFDTLQNGDRLISLLRRNSFDLLIHGHKHHYRVQCQNTGVGDPLVIVCAGSFSALMEGMPRPMTNQFHLIEIDEQKTSAGGIQGQVKSWSYHLLSGWEKSRDFHDLASSHVEHFGIYLTATELSKLLEPLVEKALNEHQIITWDDLSSERSELRRVPNEQRSLVLKQLEGKVDFTMRTDKDTEEIILYRR